MFDVSCGRRSYGNALSPAEKATLLHAVYGTSSDEIGRAMCKSPATVKTHLQNAYRKLGVKNRAAAAMQMMKLGLLQ